MARRQIGREVFAFIADPVSHYRSSLDRLSGLIDRPSVDRHLVDICTSAKGEPDWPPLAQGHPIAKPMSREAIAAFIADVQRSEEDDQDEPLPARTAA